MGDYGWSVHRRVLLGPDAIRQLRALRAYDATALKDAMRHQLAETDATEESQQRFRLRRPSDVVEFELRVGKWRVFYRVKGDASHVVLIGEKLLIAKKRFVP